MTYFGFGFGGFSTPVVSYAPLPILSSGASDVTILLGVCFCGVSDGSSKTSDSELSVPQEVEHNRSVAVFEAKS